MNPATVAVPFPLLEQILDDLYELKGEWEWKKDEERLGFADSYLRLSSEIDRVAALLNEAAKSNVDKSQSGGACLPRYGNCDNPSTK